MTGDEYIEMVLSRHEFEPHLFSTLSTNAIIVPKLKEWVPWLNHLSYVGSLAKGTGVSGTTDRAGDRRVDRICVEVSSIGE